MKVSLSALVKIAQLAKSSIGNIQLRIVLKKAEEVVELRSTILIYLLIFLFILIIAMVLAIVVLQDLLETNSRKELIFVHQPVAPASESCLIEIQEVKLASKGSTNLVASLSIQTTDELNFKTSNSDVSTAYAEAYSESQHEPTSQHRDETEEYQMILFSVGALELSRKMRRTISEKSDNMVYCASTSSN